MLGHLQHALRRVFGDATNAKGARELYSRNKIQAHSLRFVPLLMLRPSRQIVDGGKPVRRERHAVLFQHDADAHTLVPTCPPAPSRTVPLHSMNRISPKRNKKIFHGLYACIWRYNAIHLRRRKEREQVGKHLRPEPAVTIHLQAPPRHVLRYRYVQHVHLRKQRMHVLYDAGRQRRVGGGGGGTHDDACRNH